ncbi:MFS transporter [Streptomyces sp. SID3343]|uniref:MFS transporter n=1 Tax=Streptomyces sp. SID3343 TaxID=2690260 RepID=UPI0019289C50|nr:MFS transporter [Streptomyces sp. SID3343]
MFRVPTTPNTDSNPAADGAPQSPPPAAVSDETSERPPPAAARSAAGRIAGAVLADVTPLREFPDFRRLWFGHSVSSLGQQMTAVAVAIQVYALTESNFAVGLVGLFSVVPLIVFGLVGGAIADSVDRRLVGLVSACGLASVSILLAVQAFLDLGQVWLLYGAVAVQSAFFAVNNPARTSMIPKLLPADRLPAANALNSIAMALAMTVGPMLGGVVIGLWSFQAAYVIDTLAFSAALYAMWRLPSMPPTRAADGRTRASVTDGLRFLRSRPNVRMTFMTDIVAMVFGMPRALFPAMAATLYGGGAGTVGLLVAAPAVGALAGGLFSGWLGRVQRQGRAVVIAVLAWGTCIAAFGLGGPLWLGLILLALAGCADTISMVFRNTIMQVATPDEMRGRLAGVFIVVVAGGPRLGDFEAGSVAALSTERISVVGGGLACVVLVIALSLRWRGFWRYDARDPQP